MVKCALCGIENDRTLCDDCIEHADCCKGERDKLKLDKMRKATGAVRW